MVDIPGCCLVEFRPYLSCFSQLFRLRMGYMRRYRCRHLAAGAIQQVCRCAIHCFRSSRLPPGISGSLLESYRFWLGQRPVNRCWSFRRTSLSFSFLAFVIVGLWALTIFWARKPGPTYVSQWYILGAFLWFVWMYTTANILLNIASAPGPAQPAIDWWYIGSLSRSMADANRVGHRILSDSETCWPPDL